MAAMHVAQYQAIRDVLIANNTNNTFSCAGLMTPDLDAAASEAGGWWW